MRRVVVGLYSYLVTSKVVALSKGFALRVCRGSTVECTSTIYVAQKIQSIIYLVPYLAPVKQVSWL